MKTTVFNPRCFASHSSIKRGFINMEQLRQLAVKDEIETVVVAFTDIYGRLMGKRFGVDFFLNNGIDGTHCCSYLLATDMNMQAVPGYKYANWEKGYGDFHIVPDLSSMRVAAWQNKTVLVLCDAVDHTKASDHHHDPHHGPAPINQLLPYAPRSLLRKQVQALADMEYTSAMASELEYYIYRNSYKQAMQKNYTDLEPAGWYLEDYHILQATRNEDFNAAARKYLTLSGLEVETTKGEAGTGQHELNIKYSDPLGMADNHVIYKQCLKEIAEKMGISVTFMPKPLQNQSGSGCHIHLSVLNRDGSNAFYVPGGSGTQGAEEYDKLGCSDLFRWFLGGWIKHTRELMCFYAPTINSYKRFTAGSWAPTHIAVGVDNRTAGFRVVGQNTKGLRIECRIPGADCNVYLAFAAAIASGLDGVANRIEPPKIFDGDIYSAQSLPQVPMTLHESIKELENSEFARSAFGTEVVDHYVHFYRTEQKAFDKAVTTWEMARYFEQI